MNYLYFTGTAGSGKSSLVHAYQEWLDNIGLESIIVNLDPGADYLPYNADVDIRDWVNLSEVMEDYSLGPNGAQIAAADLMAVNIKEWGPTVKEMGARFALVDTPGQMELFAFRQSSTAIIDELGRDSGFLLFLSDPMLAKSPNGFVSDMMLCAITQFRFSIPILNILSKSDILSEEVLTEMEMWAKDPYALYNALTDGNIDSQSIMNLEFLKAMESVGMYRELTPVSSEDGTGMEDIYNAVQQYFEGGEDAE